MKIRWLFKNFTASSFEPLLTNAANFPSSRFETFRVVATVAITCILNSFHPNKPVIYLYRLSHFQYILVYIYMRILAFLVHRADPCIQPANDNCGVLTCTDL